MGWDLRWSQEREGIHSLRFWPWPGQREKEGCVGKGKSPRRDQKMFLLGHWEYVVWEGESGRKAFGRWNRSSIGRGICTAQRRPGYMGPHSTCQQVEVGEGAILDGFSRKYLFEEVLFQQQI